MKNIAFGFKKNEVNMIFMARGFGTRIRNIRDSKGLTIEGLSAKAGLTSGYVGRLEREEEGYDNPTLSTIETIADALEVHPSLLLYGNVLEPTHELEAEGKELDRYEKEFVAKLRMIPGKSERKAIENVMNAFVRSSKK